MHQNPKKVIKFKTTMCILYTFKCAMRKTDLQLSSFFAIIFEIDSLLFFMIFSMILLTTEKLYFTNRCNFLIILAAFMHVVKMIGSMREVLIDVMILASTLSSL